VPGQQGEQRRQRAYPTLHPEYEPAGIDGDVRRELCALELPLCQMSHPFAGRAVNAPQAPEDGQQQDGEAHGGRAHAREPSRLPDFHYLAQRRFELLGRRDRDLDLGLACQFVGVRRRHAENAALAHLPGVRLPPE
jgi:hypothetical protein